MKEYKITINEVPASANHPIDDIKTNASNRRASWQDLIKYKKRWEKKVKYEAMLMNLPDLNKKQVEIKFRFYHPISRKRDHDNYFIAMKGMIDGLFTDDDSQYVKCNYPDMLIDKDNPRVEILITEE